MYEVLIFEEALIDYILLYEFDIFGFMVDLRDLQYTVFLVRLYLY